MAEREEVRSTIRKFFRQLNYMFFVFLAGIIIFSLVAWIVTAGGEAPMNSQYETFLRFAAPISGIALILMSNRLFANRIREGRTAEKLYQKMDAYRAGAVIRMLVLDGAAFINLISFVMAGNYLFLFLCLAILIMFILTKPSLEKFITDMQLSEMEEQVMRDHTI